MTATTAIETQLRAMAMSPDCVNALKRATDYCRFLINASVAGLGQDPTFDLRGNGRSSCHSIIRPFQGDVIVEFNGQRIENDGHLVKQVGLTPIGTQVSIIIFREGVARRVTAVLEPNPEG